MANTGTAVLDFGSFPGSNEASVSITGESGISGGSKTDAWIAAVATSDHSINDHAYAAALVGVTTGAPTAGVGFTIYGRSEHQLTGQFNVEWAWA